MGRIAVGRHVVWAALLALLAAPFAGCATAFTPPRAAPSVPAEPRVALLAAAARTAELSCKLELGDAGDKGIGVYDPTAHAATFAMEVDGKTGTVTVTSFGVDVYVSGFPGVAGRTLHFDVTRFAPDSSLLLILDPMLALHLITAATEVTRTATGFHGTIDLRKVDTTGYPAAKVIVDGLAATAGAVAAVRAFDATVDDQGRLSMFRTTFRSADDGRDDEYQLNLSDFGSGQTVTRPTSDVVDAPADLYAGAGSAKG